VVLCIGFVGVAGYALDVPAVADHQTRYWNTNGVLTIPQARQWMIFAPKPAYPDSAVIRRIQGSGLFKLIVRVKTGRVQRVVTFSAIGDSALDAAAIQALRQWRFTPGGLPSMRQLDPLTKQPDANEDACVLVPITFTR
jgi:TonB family protein